MRTLPHHSAGLRPSPWCKSLHLLLLFVLFSQLQVPAAHAQVFNLLYVFPPGSGSVVYPNGAYPQSNLVEVSPGMFFTAATDYGGGGTTCPGVAGLPGCGTIVEIDATLGTATVVHQFAGTDGATPIGVLTLASDGYVYGVTQHGGSPACAAQFGCGTVFRIYKDGSGFEVIHNFGGLWASDGQEPSGIVQGTDGNLYGATSFGGVPQNYGTLFMIKPPFSAAASYSNYLFPTDASVGVRPQVPMQAADGKIYGSCSSAFGGHAMYVLDPLAPTPTVSVALNTPDDGIGGLVQGSGGAFYGVSSDGGANHIGSVFRSTLGPPTASTTMYSFAGGTLEGEFPQAGLLLASDGMLYGTTGAGGDPGCSGCGTTFVMVPGKTSVSTTHIFRSWVDGGYPKAPLIEGSDGFIYGTNYGWGPAGGAGTVFRFSKTTLPLWDQQFGEVGVWDGASSVVADSTGKVYVAGVAGTKLDPKGTGSFYIVRFKPDGTPDTTFNGSGFVQFGPGLSTDYMARIRLDKTEKSVYVAGYTAGNLYPGLVNQGGFDGWVARFTNKGKLIWAHMLGTPQDDRLFDIALDLAGKVYLTGSTTGNLGGTLQGVRDAFFGLLTAKLNKVTKQYDFTLKSSQTGATGETRWGSRVAYCKNVGPAQMYADGYDDVSGNAWLVRLNAKNVPAGPVNGVVIAGGSGPGFFEAHGVGADSKCNVYMAGHNVSQPQPPIIDEHYFVNKYDYLLGGLLWEADGPMNSGNTIAPEDFISDLAVDSKDRVFVGGTTSSPTLYGGTNQGQDAPFYAAYDATGKRVGSAVAQFLPGPSVITEGQGIFPNPTGVYMVGSTNGNVAGHPDSAFSDAYVYAFSPLP